jgi:esterase
VAAAADRTRNRRSTAFRRPSHTPDTFTTDDENRQRIGCFGGGRASAGKLGDVVTQEWISLGSDGRGLSYLDFGGDGPLLLALHGTFGRGAVFAQLAADLRGLVRVVAPDQRAHGYSDHRGGVSREDFVSDAAAFVRGLGVRPVAVLGHSLGGITAYQLAADHPELMETLIIEDVGPVMRQPEIAHPVLDVRGWPRSAVTKQELEGLILDRGMPDAGYFMQSAVLDNGRWRLLFDWDQMMEVQAGGVGDWWADWLGSSCPALVLHGGHSTLLPVDLARQMVARRSGAHLVEFPGAGHWIHDDDPTGFADAIAAFLSSGVVRT